mgnify:CR=1 FL=1
MMFNIKYISILFLSVLLSNNASSQETSLVNKRTELNIISSKDHKIKDINQIEHDNYIKEVVVENIDVLDDLEMECNYTLKLTNKNKKSQLLRLEGFCSDNINLIFEDFNFDGYPDLRITTQNLSDVDVLYSLYIYSPKKEKFKDMKIGINNPSINKEKKVMVGFNKISSYEQSFTILDIKNKTISEFFFNYKDNEGKAIKYNLDYNNSFKNNITKLEYEKTLDLFIN